MARTSPEIPAAGVVILRDAEDGREVVLVHRPKYDDWSFPKGKVERGEPVPVAAVREVLEETGLRVALGRPLMPQRYPVEDGRKVVHYWVGRVADGASDDVSSYEVNKEIDGVAWVPVEEARGRLTYDYDRDTLVAAERLGERTTALVVVRHGTALGRKEWAAEDRLRPLDDTGRRQAVTLAGLLHAYDVRRLITSPSTRCVQTLAPYARLAGIDQEEVVTLSEEGADADGVTGFTSELVDRIEVPTAVCSHRPVLPWVFEGVKMKDARLEKGEVAVLHVEGGVVRAVEAHQG